jgi:hypothetical protein
MIPNVLSVFATTKHQPNKVSPAPNPGALLSNNKKGEKFRHATRRKVFEAEEELNDFD